MIQDCGGDGTPGPVHHTYFNTDCSGSPTYSQQIVSVPNNACASATAVQCTAYFRAIDCGGCTTQVDHPDIVFGKFNGVQTRSTKIVKEGGGTGPGRNYPPKFPKVLRNV